MNIPRLFSLVLVIAGLLSLYTAQTIISKSSLSSYIITTGSNIKNSHTYSQLTEDQVNEINKELDKDRLYYSHTIRCLEQAHYLMFWYSSCAIMFGIVLYFRLKPAKNESEQAAPSNR
jgi:hypothetical protein